MEIIFYTALSLTLCSLFALLAAPLFFRPAPGARRMLEVVRSTRGDQRRIGDKERTEQASPAPPRSLRSWLGSPDDTKWKQRFISPGLRAGNQTEVYFACRLL